ncbi:MAG: cytochrome c3 family protein, partial [Prolixibacteraceae bacterium]|nr:cytochrome c3 family protein [Prolixibacteraceae bacterium]
MGKTNRQKTSIRLILAVFISLFLVTVTPSAIYAEEDQHDSVITDGHSKEDITRGQRFFMGLLPRNNEGPSCVSCHNLKLSDTLNWNPSALEIAIKYSTKSYDDFQQAVKQPVGIKMEQVHQNFQIEDEDLQKVKLYLDDFAHTGIPKQKISISNLMLFLFLGIVMAFLLLDLIFFRKIKPRFIHVIIIVGALSWQISIVVKDAIRLGRQENYAPDQPIKFSHKVHAGENGIDCMYCHTTVEQSKSAGIPAANLCMNCHIIIREGNNSGKFEISKVVQANETGTPIEWTRIHNLPDHVFFSHAVHVGSGKLDC